MFGHKFGYKKANKNDNKPTKKDLKPNQCKFKNKESMLAVFERCDLTLDDVAEEEILSDGTVIITFTSKKHWTELITYNQKIIISEAVPKYVKKYEFDKATNEISYYDVLYAKNAEDMIEKLEKEDISRNDIVSIFPESNIIAAIIVKKINIRKELYEAHVDFSKFLLEHLAF